MSSPFSGKIPLAPYPPLVSEKGKDTTGSAGRSSTSRPAIVSSKKLTNLNASTVTGGGGNTNVGNNINNNNVLAPKRQHPARIEFHNSHVYGAINCLGNTLDSGTSSSISAGTGGFSNMQPTSSQPISSLSRMNKLGPILLELRCLCPKSFGEEGVEDDDNIDEHNDHDEDSSSDNSNTNNNGKNNTNTNTSSISPFSWYQGRTFAVSRGRASLGKGVTSTCLSFRKQNGEIPHEEEEKGKVHCATGLSSGALLIHSLNNIDEYARIHMEAAASVDVSDYNSSAREHEQERHIHTPVPVLDSASNSDDVTAVYFQSRHHRPASAVAWRWSNNGGTNPNHVAIGYNSVPGDRANPGPRSPAPMQRPGSDGSAGGFAFVWDVEAQSTAAKGMEKVPIHKLAHRSSVASLSWIAGGDLLAIGCQHRNLQIYDLRMSGAPTISTHAHDNSVNGIEADPHRSNVIATFSRGLAEPVKLWDIRKTDKCVLEVRCLSEIKTNATTQASSSSTTSTGDSRKELPTFVSAIAWDETSEGVLSIATGDDLRFYNTRNDMSMNMSRPTLSRVTHSYGPLQCISFPLKDNKPTESNNHPPIPQRMLAVYTDGTVTDLPTQQVSPIDLSSRDGRVANAIGSHVFIGSTSEGPAAMEKTLYNPSEDISATMMRRARCLHMKRYSTDATSNLQMLSLEQEAFLAMKEVNIESDDENIHLTSLEHLHLLWSWIERVEKLCFRNGNDSAIDGRFWPARTLCDAGVLHLLRLDVADIDEVTTFESFSKSVVFNRNVYDSPLRRAALTACGWNGKFGLKDVLSDTESFGHFERSAALACWHGDLGETVAALQRGAEHVRLKMTKKEVSNNSSFCNSQYGETLELVAMCVAGYSSATVWKNACQNLLNRPNLRETKNTGSNYLRAICSFLIDDSNLDKTLRDISLNLSDRVAFACIYLARKELKDYLESCIDYCLKSGNLEGLLITGLNKKGIALLQSYVDSRSDVQTAALVSSRAIFPMDWVTESVACSEWLSSYREFLNKNQMWQSRAMFDVGRVELLRKLKDRQQADTRRPTNQSRRQIHGSVTPIPPFPPQIHARCNYCQTSLPLAKLRRQVKIANNWLSRQKPVLSCCPNLMCRKPLPRCSICLLPLSCLNPYMELRREGMRLPRGTHGQHRGEDLSALASLPFAEWFTWCAKCHHGGHAHHYVSWFENHDVCPVSNCDCRCQFDVIQKLKRPSLTIGDNKE